MLEEQEQRSAAGELAVKRQRVAGPWCWANGWFTVQAVKPGSFRKDLIGVHVS